MPVRRDGSFLDFLQKLQGYKTNWSFDAVLHLGNFILGAWCYFAVKLNQPLYCTSQNSTDNPAPQHSQPVHSKQLIGVGRLGGRSLMGTTFLFSFNVRGKTSKRFSLLHFNKILYLFLV